MANTRKTTAPRGSTPATFAQVAARIRRPQRIVELVTDAAAAAEIDALSELLDRALLRDQVDGGEALAPAVARRLQDAEQRADTSRVQFVLQAVSHTRYQELRAEHPPTAEQLAADPAAPFDADSFAPVLVHAQLLEPAPASAEEFAAFWDELADGQLNRLWASAVAVQLQITTLAPRSRTAIDVLAKARAE